MPPALTAAGGRPALWARADGWLFGQGTAHRLGSVRTGLAVVIGLRVALGPFAQFAGQPAALFVPPGVLGWMGAMPSRPFLVALQVVGTGAALAAILGRRPRACFAVAWACLLVLAGLKASLGKVLHNDVLLLLASVPLMMAPASARPGDRSRSVRYGWPVNTALVVLAVAYFSSGAQKLAQSGLGWVTGDNMVWVMSQAATGGLSPAPELALFVAQRPWLATAAAAGILTLELAFPLVVLFPRARPVLLAAAVAFHFGTWALLGLDYWAWALTDVVVLADWDRLVPALVPARR